MNQKVYDTREVVYKVTKLSYVTRSTNFITYGCIYLRYMNLGIESIACR